MSRGLPIDRHRGLEQQSSRLGDPCRRKAEVRHRHPQRRRWVGLQALSEGPVRLDRPDDGWMGGPRQNRSSPPSSISKLVEARNRSFAKMRLLQFVMAFRRSGGKSAPAQTLPVSAILLMRGASMTARSALDYASRSGNNPQPWATSLRAVSRIVRRSF
jgi:hypothetical protein